MAKIKYLGSINLVTNILNLSTSLILKKNTFIILLTKFITLALRKKAIIFQRWISTKLNMTNLSILYI